MFTELLGFHNAVKQLTSFAKLYYYVHITMIYVALVEFYDIWMVYLLEYSELFFK